MKKVLIVLFFIFPLLSCDGDFRQGSCDEGFFEQVDGNGGSFCVPITDEGEGTINDKETTSYDSKEIDESL